MLENRRQLQAHRGPLFDHWRRRCLAAYGVVDPEDEPELAELDELTS